MADSFTPEQIENMNRFFELINSSLSPLSQLSQNEMEAAAAAREQAATMRNLSNEINKSLKGSLVSLYSGAKSAETGLSKYGETVTNVTNAVGNFGIQMGGAARAAGYFVKALGSVTDAAFQQNDALMAAYESLSELGSVTQTGLGGLKDQLNDIGLASYEFNAFVETLRPITGSLTSFGGSLSAGRDALVNVLGEFVGVDNELELSLNRIGYSATAIRDGVADYVQMQTRLGKAQGKSTTDLVNESHKYLIEMRGLQELTGMTRDEQQKARDAMMTDSRFSLHLAGLKDEEAKNLQNYMIGYQKAFGPEAAQGLKDRIINAGAITTDAAGASFMRGNQEYELAMKAQREGMAVFQESLVQTALNTKKTIDTFRESLKFAEGGMDSMGLTNNVVNGTLQLTNTNSKNYRKTMDELFAATQDQSDQTAFFRDQQESQYRRDQEARAARLRDDDLLSKVSGGLIGVFDGLTRIVTFFNKMLAQAIDFITKNSGGIFTPTDLSRFYETGGAGASGGGIGNRRGLGGSARQQGNNPLPTSATGDEAAILDRLNFGGQRAERTGGGPQDPALLALADRINSQLSGITITAMNDSYHHTAPGRGKSKHKIGKAMDFALDHNPDQEEAEEILDLLRQMGGINAINEYTNGRRNGSGGHFHVEVARSGGLFSGKESGYPVMLHGKNESVWPEKDIKSFMKDVQKTSLEQYKQELMSQILPGATNSNSNGSIVADAFSAFSAKLDTLIAEQRNNNNIQNEILTYTRA